MGCGSSSAADTDTRASRAGSAASHTTPVPTEPEGSGGTQGGAESDPSALPYGRGAGVDRAGSGLGARSAPSMASLHGGSQPGAGLDPVIVAATEDEAYAYGGGESEDGDHGSSKHLAATASSNTMANAFGNSVRWDDHGNHIGVAKGRRTAHALRTAEEEAFLDSPRFDREDLAGSFGGVKSPSASHQLPVRRASLEAAAALAAAAAAAASEAVQAREAAAPVSAGAASGLGGVQSSDVDVVLADAAAAVDDATATARTAADGSGPVLVALGGSDVVDGNPVLSAGVHGAEAAACADAEAVAAAASAVVGGEGDVAGSVGDSRSVDATQPTIVSASLAL